MPAETNIAIRLAVKDVEEARRRLRSLGTDGEDALADIEHGSRAADRSMERFGNRLRDTERRVVGFGRQIAYAAASFAAFIGASVGVRELVDTSLQFQRIGRALEFATGNATLAAQEFEFLREQSERLNFAILDTAEAYGPFVAAARGAGIALTDVRNVFVGVQEAAATLGLSSDQSSRALVALQQIASKGQVSMEELRQQLGEAIPDAMGIMARGLGVTTGELNKLVAEGLSARVGLKAFGDELREEFGEGAEQAATQLQGALTSVRNALDEVNIRFAQTGALEAWTSLIFDFGDWVSRNKDAIVGILYGIADAVDQIIRQTAKEISAVIDFFDKLVPKGTIVGDQLRATFSSFFDLPELKTTEESIKNAAIAMEDMVGAADSAGGALAGMKSAAEDLADPLEAVTEELWEQIGVNKLILGAEQKSAAAGEQMRAHLKAASEARKIENDLKKEGVELSHGPGGEYETILMLIESNQDLEAQIKATTAARRDALKAQEEQRREMERSIKTQDEFGKSVRDLIADRKDEADAAAEQARREAQRLADQQAELLLEPAKNAIRALQNTTADFFQDVLKGGVKTWEDLWSSFTDIATRAIAEVAAQRIFVNVSANLASNIAGSAGFGNLVQQGGLLGAFAPGLAANINQAASNFLNQYIPSPPLGLFGTNQTLTGALSSGLLGVAGGGLLGSLLRFNGAGRTGSQAGGGIGALAGSFFGPLGGLLGGGAGGLIGGLIGNLFGGKDIDQLYFQGGHLIGLEDTQIRDAFHEWDQSILSALDKRTRNTVHELIRNFDSVQRPSFEAGDFDILTEGFSVFADRARQFVAKAFPDANADALFRGIGPGQEGNIEELANRIIGYAEFVEAVQSADGDIHPAVQAVRDIREQFSGFLKIQRQVGGVDRADIIEQRGEALKAVRQGVLQPLRELAGITKSGLAAAIDNIRTQFDLVRQSADELGISLSRINSLEQRATRNLRQGSIESVLALAGPGPQGSGFQAFTSDFRAGFRELVKNADELGISEERLQNIRDRGLRRLTRQWNQSVRDSNQVIRDQIRGLRQQFGGIAQQAHAAFQALYEPLQATLGGLFSSLNPQAQFGGLNTLFGNLVTQARGGNISAIEQLPGVAGQLLTAAGTYGASPLVAEVSAQIRDAFGPIIDKLLSQEERATRGIPDLYDATVENTSQLVTQFREQTKELKAEIRGLRQDLKKTR